VPEDTQIRVLEKLSSMLPELSPQQQKAAGYVIEHPERVALDTVRQTGADAGVHPNALVQVARLAGFDGYRDFREAFARHIKDGAGVIKGRARALQRFGTGGAHDRLYNDLATGAISNVESMYAANDPTAVRKAADAIMKAEHAYILGVGVGYALAHNFWYVAHMALRNVVQIPRPGHLPIDDLARVGRNDVLLAINFHPYRTDVLAAVELARSRRATLIAVTDDRVSPVALLARHVFVTPVESPQFFTSLVGVAALMETLLSFVVAGADKKVLKQIETFHKIRYDSGVYIQSE
jgi:DNA-binding MurR/RpiR family transcriptional regulator